MPLDHTTGWLCTECGFPFVDQLLSDQAESLARACHTAGATRFTTEGEYLDATMKWDASEANRILEKGGTTYINAFVQAGDNRSAIRASHMLMAGQSIETALAMVGSYARMRFANENLPDEFLLPQVCDLWRGSDPDDTDPAFLAMWQRLADMNGGYLSDNEMQLPNTVRVFRGQLWPREPYGISWTTDPAIAEKFARGAGIRSGAQKGWVIAGRVQRRFVLGHMTGRGESEVIADPKRVVIYDTLQVDMVEEVEA